MYNWSWPSLNNSCCTSRNWNGGSINCYGINSSCRCLAVSSLNTISSLISKALSDDSISDEEYSLLLFTFETFTRMKEDLTEKSKTSLEKTGNIETEANELLRGNKIDVLT